MPAYLIHGFMWLRQPIREFVIINNINDAAPDYIMQQATQVALKDIFEKKYPDVMQAIPHLSFIEQYDPEDLTQDHYQPYAFVANKVLQVKLSVNVERARTASPMSTTEYIGMRGLRDALAKGAEIGWYIVYNGDPLRNYEEDIGEEMDEESTEEGIEMPGEPAVESSLEEDKSRNKGKGRILQRIFRRHPTKGKDTAPPENLQPLEMSSSD